jgi:DGQHR domain-containing protein
MFTPTNLDLTCHVIRGQEGIGTIYTSNLTYIQFCTFFSIADIDIEEFDKMQRDPTKSRVKGVFSYLTSRKNTVFPLVTCIATKVDFKPLKVASLNGVSLLGELTLPASSERIIIDGQGRLLGIEEALKIASYLKLHTIDFKFFATGTETLLESKNVIQQVFSDYHKKVVKPNPSINLFFDSSSTSSTFVLEAYKHLSSLESNFGRLISLEGNNKRIWTLAQFKLFLRRFTGLTDKEMDKDLNEPEQINMWLNFLTVFFEKINTIPIFNNVNTPNEIKFAKDDSLLCCAIGIESLGYLASILLDDAISSGASVSWEQIDNISSIDFSKNNELWVNEVITQDKKMIKGSAKQMAIVIASKLRIALPLHLLSNAA